MRDEIEGLKNRLISLVVFFALIVLIVCYVSLNSEVLKNPVIPTIIEVLKVVATTFGGAAILFNVFYAAKRAKAMDDSAIAANKSAEAALDNAKAALKNAEAAQDKQITERFTKAVELLASENISIRLGGIYALERIAKDSEKDHWTIMKVLTAFVREKAPLKKEEIQQEQLPKIPTDIQAALTIIGQRDVKRDPNNQRLNLQNTNLERVDLSGANLQGADLSGANLQGADLREANLQGADLREANLQGADLIEANLQEADFSDANLKGAYVSKANLHVADLGGTNLQGAFLIEANLQGAFLIEANLQGAFLREANLQGADLALAQNLKQEQIKIAFGDSATILPDNLERPVHWTQAE
ncbi:pentapeptide repeat-containing protein [Coleofasciculus sp. FACHB-125]|nr:pentapeptide repeat-containing protein [Coleofasciculus sp. FACHB-125]